MQRDELMEAAGVCDPILVDAGNPRVISKTGTR
jgi:hypothetical protein